VLAATPPVTDPLKTKVTNIKVHMSSLQLRQRPARQGAPVGSSGGLHYLNAKLAELPLNNRPSRIYPVVVLNGMCRSCRWMVPLIAN
jgi:hypothetical protein